jgi:hypothetical protein
LGDFSQDKGWCCFSLLPWQEKTRLPRTQLLRTRRELLEQQVIFFEPFPDETPPFATQPGNGWIGLRSMADWVIPAKSWGGHRDGAGRKKQTLCNNLNHEQPFCNNLNTWQVDCNNLISGDEIWTSPSVNQVSCNNLKTATGLVSSELDGGAPLVHADSEINLIPEEVPGSIKLISEECHEATAGAAPSPSSSKEKTYPIREETGDTNVSPGTAVAVPGGIDVITTPEETPPPPNLIASQPVAPRLPPAQENDAKNISTAEPANQGEPHLLTEEELAAWKQALESKERAIQVMPPGPEKAAASQALWPERIAYLTAKRKTHPELVRPPEPKPDGRTQARGIWDQIARPDHWRSGDYLSFICQLEPLGFKDGRLLLRAPTDYTARRFNTKLAFEALRLAGSQVEAVEACYEAPEAEERVEAGTDEAAAVEAVPMLEPTSTPLRPYATVKEYTDSMVGALIRAWGYDGQQLNAHTRGVLVRLGAQLRQSQIHPAYVGMFKAWCERTLKGLVTPDRVQSGQVAAFVSANLGLPYESYPPLAQLASLPQKDQLPTPVGQQVHAKRSAAQMKRASAAAAGAQETGALWLGAGGAD